MTAREEGEVSDWPSLVNNLNSVALAAFGRDVTYLPSAGDPVTIRAVVETAKEPEDTAPGVYVVLFLRLADLPQRPQRGDEVSTDGVLYTVFDLEADGNGGIVLRLRQV
jgi:hypothetical protein